MRLDLDPDPPTCEQAERLKTGGNAHEFGSPGGQFVIAVSETEEA